jgi:hypothetical protein
MAINNRPLKAFVRFDGSGRIVAGSLILRKNKPKVGKWKEILAYECCNGTTTTTTTINPFPLILEWDSIENVPVANASSVSDWNTFFGLPANGTSFTSVVVVGNNVELYGGNNINLPAELFSSNTNILGVIDMASCIITAGFSCFESCNLVTIFDLPALTSEGGGCFAGCNSVTTFNLPLLATATDGCFFACTSVTTLNLPLCTNLGSTVGNNNVFLNIIGNTITATFNIVLATCNGGLPDGDIQYLTANNTLTITYV